MCQIRYWKKKCHWNLKTKRKKETPKSNISTYHLHFKHITIKNKLWVLMWRNCFRKLIRFSVFFFSTDWRKSCQNLLLNSWKIRREIFSEINLKCSILPKKKKKTISFHKSNTHAHTFHISTDIHILQKIDTCHQTETNKSTNIRTFKISRWQISMRML